MSDTAMPEKFVMDVGFVGEPLTQTEKKEMDGWLAKGYLLEQEPTTMGRRLIFRWPDWKPVSS